MEEKKYASGLIETDSSSDPDLVETRGFPLDLTVPVMEKTPVRDFASLEACGVG